MKCSMKLLDHRLNGARNLIAVLLLELEQTDHRADHAVLYLLGQAGRIEVVELSLKT